MKILALEFSTDKRGAAVSENGSVPSCASEMGGRNTHAFALIEKALAEAKVEREQIECLAIGIGPGSYTGIRTAISLAQGWQLALGAKLLGIPTMDCLAETALAAGLSGRGYFVVDAQRNEVYLGHYELGGGGFKELQPLKIIPAGDLKGMAGKGEFIAGPEIKKWVAEGNEIFPESSALAGIAARSSNYLPGEKLEPIYIRETAFVKAPPPRILPAGAA